jgi:hypothetical protein
MSRLVRCLQTCTTAAALFAILGACGLTPLSRGPRPRPYPRPPRTEVTIRSLTGTWVAHRATPDGAQFLTLTLVQSGDTLQGRLLVDERALASDPAASAFLATGGQFALRLGRTNETVVVRGRPDASADRISSVISGLWAQPEPVIFHRR